MPQTFGQSVMKLVTACFRSSLVFSLMTFLVVPAELIQQGLFFSIRSAAGGLLCAQGTPSETLNVPSPVYCAARCVSVQNCSSFNIVDVGTFDYVGCQLFAPTNIMLYSVILGCRGYQVRMTQLHFNYP
jgi:hypothetical protein